MMKALNLLAFTAVAGCSDVKVDTYEVELTTDVEPQVVELWHKPEPLSNKLGPLYRLRFPQTYYAYRDNHHALKQTTVGLFLDRQTLRPLAQIAGQETGLTETLSTPNYKEGPLKTLVRRRYQDRQLFVTIRGNHQGLGLRRPGQSDPFRSAERLPDQAGFEIVEHNHRAPHPAALPRIRGYSRRDPLIRMRCSGGVPACSFDTDYRGSTVSFTLPRPDVAQAHQTARRVLRLLDQHLLATRGSGAEH